MRYIISILSLTLLIGNYQLTGQDFAPVINKAWESNEQLKAKNFELGSAIMAYRESSAMFGPTATFGIQYTLSAGGRSIQIPVGDLLNPVYSTLNNLTSSNSFPQISNVNEQFLPNNFYDSRIRINQPVYYPDLMINKKLKKESVRLKELEIRSFKRLISADIMKAHFQCVAARQSLAILSYADTLMLEAKRSTQSMIRNGVALPSALSRIENQIAMLEAQKTEALSIYHNTVRYYNFLQGSNDDAINFAEIPVAELPDINESGINPREEIAQIEQGILLQNFALQKEKQFYYPRLGMQLDLGSQAFDFKFKPYALLGINFEMNLFDSRRHNFRREQVKLALQSSELQKSDAEDQIRLQIATAKENLSSAVSQSGAYKLRINATEKIYTEVFKKYKEGVANYLELIDAHTQLLQIKLQYNISKANAWVRWAEYIYAAAIYPVN